MKKTSLIMIIVFLSFFFILLRLPYFFEPIWYSDEAIYLTVANTLHKGIILYKDIYDLKPPLIYFIYYLFPNIITVRIISSVVVFITSFLIYKISQKLFNQLYGLISQTVFLVLMSITTFEGGIANTEVFFIFFTTLAYLIFFTSKRNNFNNRKGLIYYIIGLLFSFAFLFKTVAFFDFLLLLYFIILKSGFKKNNLLNLMIGFLSPLLIVFIYFLIKNAGTDFIQSVFFQNLSYVEKENFLIFQFGSLILKTLVFLLLMFVITKKRLHLPLSYLFLFLWLTTTEYAAIFSGRPYPHYLIQTLPALSLIFPSIISPFKFRYRLISLSILIVYILIFIGLNFYRYPIRSYYTNFIGYISAKKSENEYQNFYNNRLSGIYELSLYLKNHSANKIFVYADYPQIYLLSQTTPTTKYFMPHHLQLISNSRSYTLKQITNTKPDYIIMDNQGPLPFPKFQSLLAVSYYPLTQISDFSIFALRKY